MRRLLIIALILTGTPVPAALAAPRAVTRIGVSGDQLALGHFALAGDQLLYTRLRGRTLRLVAAPVAGGPARVVFTRTAPAGEDIYGTIAASPQRAALVVLQGPSGRDATKAQIFAGPPGGPLTPLTDPLTQAPFPLLTQVDGNRVFDYRFTGDRFDARVFAHDPDEHEVAFEDPDQGNSASFAGDLVAYRRPYEDWRQLVVRDWRSGAVRFTDTFPDAIYSVLLRADGRSLVSLFDNELWEADPPRRLAGHAFSPHLAGERIVSIARHGLRVREPDGTIRRFGTTSDSISSEISADAEHVAWIANGCLLLARITDAPAAAPAPGPCPRTEFSAFPNRAKLARALPVPVTCVSAPHRCHGTVRVPRYGRRTRFDIAPGHSGTVRAELTHAGYRALRRRVAHAPHDTVILRVIVRSSDGAVQRHSIGVGRRA